VLADRPNEDAVLQELRSIIGGMSEDEQIDLVALAWLGRGDARAQGWEELRSEAAGAHNRRTAAYLLAMRFYLPPSRTVSRNLASRPRTLRRKASDDGLPALSEANAGGFRSVQSG
jgi:hypothetical protein